MKNTIHGFIQRFLPDVESDTAITPHHLLFDTKGQYRDVSFTSTQLRDCLAAYLALIPPLLADMSGKPHIYLMKVRHDDASELLLAYLYRTQKDDDYAAVQAYVREVDAVGQINTLLDAIDPERKSMNDSIRHITAISKMLENLQDG